MIASYNNLYATIAPAHATYINGFLYHPQRIAFLVLPENCLIKTHGRVSAAKEVMWHTSVLFTGTAKSPVSIKTHGRVSAAKEVMWHTSVLFTGSRHTVMCQRPRKSCGTQVSYLQEPLSHQFQHLISL